MVKLLNFIKNFKNTKNFFSIKTNKKLIVFYSEGVNYRKYLSPVLNKFANDQNFKTVYVSSDINDNEFISSNIEIFIIGGGLFRLIFFTLLKCEFLITSLSNLNNNIKVSKNCKKIAYIPHSLCSTHKVYEKNAFQHYDIFFATGNYQKEELKKAEKINNYNSKKIFDVGYVFFENFNKKEFISVKPEKNFVVFAPSWQRDNKNLLKDFGKELIQTLIQKNFSVILRTHPEALKRSKNSINSIIKEFSREKKFFLNTDLRDFSAFKKSEILITDNGGVSIEYVYLFEKPVLYFNYSDKIQNIDFKDIDQNTFEDYFKKNFCFEERLENLPNIEKKIKQIQVEFNSQRINKAIDFLKGKIYFEEPASNKILQIITDFK